uniref:Putative secreted protein n=1 Tax=Anopheles triannulatus TaxID=58253 RepID=A0A2M4B6A3_9DIPT
MNSFLRADLRFSSLISFWTAPTAPPTAAAALSFVSSEGSEWRYSSTDEDDDDEAPDVVFEPVDPELPLPSGRREEETVRPPGPTSKDPDPADETPELEFTVEMEDLLLLRLVLLL